MSIPKLVGEPGANQMSSARDTLQTIETDLVRAIEYVRQARHALVMSQAEPGYVLELRRDLHGTAQALLEEKHKVKKLAGALQLCVNRLQEYPDAIGGIALAGAQRMLKEMKL